MSRRARYLAPGAVYHVMSRGNRKSTIYEDDTDRRFFLTLLARAVRRFELKVFEACLMGNHYHLVCETPRGNLSDIMHYVNGAFAQASNRRHGRTGHVFENRFRSLVIEREGYLRRTTRYVANNPVRARLTTDPASWRWSTYCATAGLRPAPPWLNSDWLEAAFNATTRREAQLRYRAYVNQPAARKATIDTRALALGSKPFLEAVAAAVDPRTDRPLPRGFRPLTRPSQEEIFAAALAAGHEREDGIQLAHEEHGYSLTDIASHLGLDRSTVSKALTRLKARLVDDLIVLPDWMDDQPHSSLERNDSADL